MRKPLRQMICFCALASALWLAGCGVKTGPTPPLGQKCSIQFRRDALGAGASMPVPPLTDNINGADTSVFGTLKSAQGDWVVLQRDHDELWIPKSAILLIKY